MRLRPIVYLGLLVLLLLSSNPTAAQQNERCFAETGYCMSGRIREYWEQNGGLPVFGYPIGPQREELVEGIPYQVQWFERNRLELHPENARPYDVLLGRLGAELSGGPAQPEAANPECRYFEQTGFNACGEIWQYYRSQGLRLDNSPEISEAESLALFGYPLSSPMPGTSTDGKPITMQWFERARFEIHPHNPPQSRILLGLLGNETAAAPSQPAPSQPAPNQTPAIPEQWLDRLNYYRSLVGVPTVTENPTYSANCFEHARYMAENNDITHDQQADLPYASDAGQICAQKGNAWIGWGKGWSQAEVIDGWMASLGHRLWMIYPSLQTTGFGMYTASNGVSAAGIDVLSDNKIENDNSFSGWPVIYPAPKQSNFNQHYITLLWPYFQDTPNISSSSITNQQGQSIAHQATTQLPAGHKGIALIPQDYLADNTIYTVTVSGSYAGTAFNHTWQFSTGNQAIP